MPRLADHARRWTINVVVQLATKLSLSVRNILTHSSLLFFGAALKFQYFFLLFDAPKILFFAYFDFGVSDNRTGAMALVTVMLPLRRADNAASLMRRIKAIIQFVSKSRAI